MSGINWTEKEGVIKVFADLSATAPMLTIDLKTEVNSYFDHGLSGLAIDPRFPTVPDFYVTYTYDAPIGGTAPVWNDQCSDGLGVGCVTSGRLLPMACSTTHTGQSWHSGLPPKPCSSERRSCGGSSLNGFAP